MSVLNEIKVANIHGEDVSMSLYEGQYLVIVNVASKCGFTKQYEGLEKLHDAMRAAGVSVLGFPCNQFGGQEPGTEQEIIEGCVLSFGIQFPMFAKVEVNGPSAHALYQFLKSKPGFEEDVKWNFEKFLVSPEGEVIKRYPSNITPQQIQNELQEMTS